MCVYSHVINDVLLDLTIFWFFWIKSFSINFLIYRTMTISVLWYNKIYFLKSYSFIFLESTHSKRNSWTTLRNVIWLERFYMYNVLMPFAHFVNLLSVNGKRSRVFFGWIGCEHFDIFFFPQTQDKGRCCWFICISRIYFL